MGTVTPSVRENLSAYMESNAKVDPFKTQAAMLALAGHFERDAATDVQVRRNIETMLRTARTLDGVCDLHLDLAWSAHLREVPWWQRKRVAKGEAAWKGALRVKLMNEAVRDINTIRGSSRG